MEVDKYMLLVIPIVYLNLMMPKVYLNLKKIKEVKCQDMQKISQLVLRVISGLLEPNKFLEVMKFTNGTKING